MTNSTKNDDERQRRDDALDSVVREWIADKQKTEKRSVFRKWCFAGFIVLCAVIAIASEWSKNKAPDGPYVAVVRVDGLIAPGTLASYELVAGALKKAFDDDKAAGVALVINSPGGYPTQSQMIRDTVRRLAADKGKRVIAVGEDQMTSGAYMIATGADMIYAPTTALVGSIGVIQRGYDISELAERYGVKDRTYTAGDHKDSFNPLVAPSDYEKVKAAQYLGELQGEFVRMVKQARGDRLDLDAPGLFSGEFWTGLHAVQIGLIDGNADLREAIENEFQAKAIRQYTPDLQLMDMLNLAANRQ